MRKRDDKKRKLIDKEFPTDSIIARGTKIKGTIIRTYSIRISGHFEGRINSKRLVMVDKGARIEGTIRAPHIIIEGELNGNVESAELVELRSECRMIGNINTDKIAIVEGSIFHGEIKMTKKKDIPSASESHKKFFKIKEKAIPDIPEVEDVKERLAGLKDN